MACWAITSPAPNKTAAVADCASMGLRMRAALQYLSNQRYATGHLKPPTYTSGGVRPLLLVGVKHKFNFNSDQLEMPVSNLVAEIKS